MLRIVHGAGKDEFVTEKRVDIGQSFEGMFNFRAEEGGRAVLPPVAESGAVLQLLVKNCERLPDGIAVVREGSIADGRLGQERKKMAFGARRREVEVLEFFGQLTEVGDGVFRWIL